MTVKLETKESKIFAYSPYHPNLPSKAKKLGGRWDGSAWVFDIRDEDRVKTLYKNIYGTDGEIATGDLVTLKVKFRKGDSEYHSGIFVGGRCIGRATGRDSGARLADGVVLLSGNVGSGGSVKNWTTNIRENTIVEIRDMPRKKAEEVVELKATDSGTAIEAEILENGINKKALIAEKEKLQARILEIEKMLNDGEMFKAEEFTV